MTRGHTLWTRRPSVLQQRRSQLSGVHQLLFESFDQDPPTEGRAGQVTPQNNLGRPAGRALTSNPRPLSMKGSLFHDTRNLRH